MIYKTIYDGTNELPGLVLPIMGALAASFCLLLWAFRDLLFSREDQVGAARGRRMLLYFLVGSVLFTVGTTFGAVEAYRDGPKLLAEGRALVVEGVVEGYKRVIARQDTERYTVRGVKFSYSSSIHGQGFNQPGLIREGLRVRIHYTDRPCANGCADIWKLEVAE